MGSGPGAPRRGPKVDNNNNSTGSRNVVLRESASTRRVDDLEEIQVERARARDEFKRGAAYWNGVFQEVVGVQRIGTACFRRGGQRIGTACFRRRENGAAMRPVTLAGLHLLSFLAALIPPQIPLKRGP